MSLSYGVPQPRRLPAEGGPPPPAVPPKGSGPASLYPVDAPGMPPAGPSFTAWADSLLVEGGSRERLLGDLYTRVLRTPGTQVPVGIRPGLTQPLLTVPGHLWGEHIQAHTRGIAVPPVTGPQPAEVMVVAKSPGLRESQDLRCLVGSAGETLVGVLGSLGFGRRPLSWYVTHLCKFVLPPGTASLKRTWVRDCLPLLHQELRLVRPKYILCLGTDASKAVLGPRATVAAMEGTDAELVYPTSRSALSTAEPHSAVVMTVPHPAAARRSPDQVRVLANGLARFQRLLSTGQRAQDVEEGLDYRTIRTARELDDLLEEIGPACPPGDLLAVDAEWHGEHPVNQGSYVRTVQLSWAHKAAATVVLCAAGGAPAFLGPGGRVDPGYATDRLAAFMRDRRLVGHFFVADLEWLEHLGMDVVSAFRVPLFDAPLAELPPAMADRYRALGFTEVVPAWVRTRFEGGVDTGLLGHALEETGLLGLESMAVRYTQAGRYDKPLRQWKVDYCRERQIKPGDMEGYGDCPDEVLIPYASGDADVTRRLAVALLPRLDQDFEGNCCRESFWESMLAAQVILEIHCTGLGVDKARIDELSVRFTEARDRHEQALQAWLRWPEFNVRSVFQVRELLFGEALSGRCNKETGESLRARPKGARSFAIQPLKDTAKPAMDWSRVVQRNLTRERSPSTDKTVLGTLAHSLTDPDEVECVRRIRSLRFLDQVLKGMLRSPEVGEDGEHVSDDNGLVFDKGLSACICDDGRVRTHLYPTADTGRWKSSRPNLQNCCFDAQTQLLTRRGWVPAPEVTRQDEVAQFWLSDRRIEFTRPSEVLRFPWDGPLHQFTSGQIDLCLTGDHRCLFRSKPRAGRDGWWFEQSASAFAADATDALLPQAGVYAGGDAVLSPAQATLLAAFQTNGILGDRGQVVFRTSAPRKATQVRKALVDSGAVFAESRNRPASTRFRLPASCPVGAWLRGQMPDGVFGPWVLDLNRPARDLLRDRVLRWGGRRGADRGEYSTPVEQNADWVQILEVLSGWRSRVSRFAGRGAGRRTRWGVHAPPCLRTRYAATGRVKHTVTSAADGAVYCVTVPSSYVVVRRNGKVAVTGNSKKRDNEYTTLLGKENYKHKLRSMFVPAPGHVLVEADYTGAELFAIAVQSGDPVMLSHCLQAQRPEDDPEFYDIHSNVCVLAFHLTCEPTKSALKAAGKAYLRNAAKAVIFGLAYGRGAAAISLQCREEGVDISPTEAQQIIDTIYRLYANLPGYFEACCGRVGDPGWLCSMFGRFRRFGVPEDRAAAGEMGRKAMNVGAQSAVASAIDRAGAYCQHYRDEVLKIPDAFRIVLQIHDALLFEVPDRHVEVVIDRVIPVCMRDMVPLYATDLAGVPQPGAVPQRFGYDVDVMTAWGEGLTPEAARLRGIPDRFCG